LPIRIQHRSVPSGSGTAWQLPFDHPMRTWDTFLFRANMNFLKLIALLITPGVVAGPVFAQAASAQAPARQNPQFAHPEPAASSSSSRADAYYNYTMGHIAEQQYEATSRTEYATQAIEYYKKAYALDPKSPVIGERLAEMYWKAQRV